MIPPAEEFAADQTDAHHIIFRAAIRGLVSESVRRGLDKAGRDSHTVGVSSPRILVIRPGALGDVVVTEPVIAALREAYPAAHIAVAGRTDFLPLLAGRGRADACVSMDSAAFASLFSDGPLEIPEFDIVLAFLPDADGSLSARLGSRGGRAAVFDPRPKANATAHIVDHLLAALEPLGISAARSVPRLDCRDDWLAAASALLGQLQDYAVIHPGSGGRSKLWQPEKWAAVISGLAPLPVVLTSGPADGEIAAEIPTRAADRARVRVIAGQPITTIAGVLAGAKFYLGCDSGVTHLAAALGVPTVAVFGPTDPRVWAPRGPRVQVVRGPDAAFRAIFGKRTDEVEADRKKWGPEQKE